MRAVISPEPKRYEVKDMAGPAAGPGQAVVKVMATTVCATDYKVFDGLWAVRRFPRFPGQEWSGQVVAVGLGVTQVKLGDRAMLHPHP